MGKRVLLIGGTGTISSYVAEQLAVDDSVELFLLNRGTRSQPSRCAVRTIKGDINDFEGVRATLEGQHFDVVCNFITYTVEQAVESFRLFYGKTSQFIHISTAAVYDRQNHCLIDETTPLGNPYNNYGLAKAEIERYYLQQYKEKQFPVTIVRPSQTYARERIPLSVKGKSCWSVVDRMLAGKPVIIHGDGQSVWACTHSADFARAFVGLVGNPASVGDTYQIVNETPYTWDMIYQTLADLLGVEYRPVYITTSILKYSRKYDLMETLQGDKRSSCLFNTAKIKTTVPGLRWKIDIKTGLAMYLSFMEQHPDRKYSDEGFSLWCNAVIAQYEALTARIKEII